jgi:hypothetical protein
VSMRTLTSSSSGGECRNPSIWLATKARGLQGCEVAGLEVDPGVTSHAPGSAKSPKSVRE